MMLSSPSSGFVVVVVLVVLVVVVVVLVVVVVVVVVTTMSAYCQHGPMKQYHHDASSCLLKMNSPYPSWRRHLSRCSSESLAAAVRFHWDERPSA